MSGRRSYRLFPPHASQPSKKSQAILTNLSRRREIPPRRSWICCDSSCRSSSVSSQCPVSSAHAQSKPAAAKAPRTGVVTLPSGVQVRYVERGAVDPSRVVIMLHGYTDSSYSFQSLMDRLDPTIQAIAIDQRGHGDSSKPGCCYAPQDFAADVVAFMDARQIKTATIVGHSMGGVIAQLVAITVARARVRAGDRRLVAELRQSGGRRAARRGQGAERSGRSEIRPRVPGEHGDQADWRPASSIATSTRA